MSAQLFQFPGKPRTLPWIVTDDDGFTYARYPSQEAALEAASIMANLFPHDNVRVTFNPE